MTTADDDARMPDVSREPRRHHDPLAVRTVFVAPRRANRPTDVGATDASSPLDCPFCSGNEALTPPDVLRMPADPGQLWHARLIPNRFPVVEEFADGPLGAAADSIARLAHGVHDVVIESRSHARSILEVDPNAWRDVWELCRRRIAMFADRGTLAWATVFKNSGPAAGASLEHLHSQLVALDFVPPTLAAELAAAGQSADPFGAALRQAEREDRIVATAADLVALVPPAPRQPFEMLLLPRSAEPHFHATSGERVAALADLTRAVIGALDRLVPGADYNWWLHQAPFTAHAPAAPPPANWHWHLEILPRLTNIAGFELGTGCHITTMSPAESARRLRAARFSSPAVTPGTGGPPRP